MSGSEFAPQPARAKNGTMSITGVDTSAAAEPGTLIDRSIAQTLDRGIDVLECITRGESRVDEISASTGLKRTVVQRLLTTFARRGYIENSEGNGWKPGLRLIELVGDVFASIDPGGVLQRTVADLAEEVHDSVHLGVLDGDDIVYVAKAHGSRQVQMISRVGLRIPAQNTALGKAILSLGDIDAAVERFDPDKSMTPLSIKSKENYRAALLESRERGYGLDNQETTPGITCIAVPLLLGPNRSPLSAAISVSAPSEYVDHDRLAELSTVMHRHARIIAPLVQAALSAGRL